MNRKTYTAPRFESFALQTPDVMANVSGKTIMQTSTFGGEIEKQEFNETPLNITMDVSSDPISTSTE